MATQILMPALSPTMTEGNLARWLKQEGDTIKAGDVIAEIETDKATMEVEAVDEGVLGRILVAEGAQAVKVNTPIALLVAPGEVAPEAVSAPPPARTSSPPPAVSGPARSSTAPEPAPSPGNGEAARPPKIRVFASPLARRMAKQTGLNLAMLKGSGPNGRIVRADIETALAQGALAPLPPPPAVAEAAAPTPVVSVLPTLPKIVIGAPHRLMPHTTMRKIIAQRLSEAKQTIPHFYLSLDIALDALLKLRSELNACSPAEGPSAFKLSVNDLIIKAAALALKRVPGCNASWTEEGIALYDDIDISIAVAIPDGLITPIIRQADRKGLAAISREMKELIARARVGRLKPEEYQGGGFSISNLGMFGVRDFAAVINPPQAAILAVGAGVERAVVKDGALAVATIMICTLSVDHRVIDGALGAQWLAAFRALVEDPLSLIL